MATLLGRLARLASRTGSMVSIASVAALGVGCPFAEMGSEKSLGSSAASKAMYDRRMVWLSGRVDAAMAKQVIEQLIHLNDKDPHQPILLLISSGGGKVSAGLAILDVMNHISSPVHTTCLGSCASMAAIILAGGAAGNRGASEHSSIMIHQPASETKGQVTDMKIRLNKSIHTKDTLRTVLAKTTGQTEEQVEAVWDRDYYMTPEQAQAFGLIDKIGLKFPIHKPVPLQGKQAHTSNEST
eukprot:TRINITY_DN23959_c0_g1_i1.p1 TRINITY_DN23959_c0_g1~~TRINITY_DN23959_c0_g1_i1.p1  ORF type:complete len:241 (+),score=31.86 TRINITY_DN23959_c0_g1_i1:230-952(+)